MTKKQLPARIVRLIDQWAEFGRTVESFFELDSELDNPDEYDLRRWQGLGDRKPLDLYLQDALSAGTIKVTDVPAIVGEAWKDYDLTQWPADVIELEAGGLPEYPDYKVLPMSLEQDVITQEQIDRVRAGDRDAVREFVHAVKPFFPRMYTPAVIVQRMLKLSDDLRRQAVDEILGKIRQQDSGDTFIVSE